MDCPQWETDGATKLSAAWLIEHAGFARGFGRDVGTGTASLSTKHTLALTNRGGATTADLLALARVIQAGGRGAVRRPAGPRGPPCSEPPRIHLIDSPERVPREGRPGPEASAVRCDSDGGGPATLW